MMVQSGSDIIRFDPKTTSKRDRDYRVENYHKKVVGKAHEFDTFLPQSTEYEGNVYWMGYQKQQYAKFNLADKTVEIVGRGKKRKVKVEMTKEWKENNEWGPEGSFHLGW